MSIIDWGPADGDLCQGDVLLFRVPDGVTLALTEEIKSRDGRLILAEGEVTGHHHAIRFPQPVMFRDDGLARELAPGLDGYERAHNDAVADEMSAARAGSARLYRDPAAVNRLIALGEITHGRFAIGFLVVEGAPVILRHDEHDAVRIPVGRYYVGGQSEWDAAEERRVAD